jgi:hypothetical protein
MWLTGKNYRINYFLAAFIGAFLAVLIEKKFRRIELGLYTFNQAMEVVFKMLVERGNKTSFSCRNLSVKCEEKERKREREKERKRERESE